MKVFLGFILTLSLTLPSYATPSIGSNCTSLKKETSPVSSSSANLATTPTIGNKIKVFVSTFSASSYVVSTVTDNQSNTYNLDKSKQGTSTVVQAVEVFSGYAATSSGTFTVTVHFHATSGANASWMACEVSGLTASSSLDQTGSSETLSGTALTVTATGANVQASELIAACIYDGNGGNTASGYTQLLSDTTLIGFWCGYKIVGSIETSSASWTYPSFADALGVITSDKAITGVVVSKTLLTLGIGD